MFANLLAERGEAMKQTDRRTFLITMACASITLAGCPLDASARSASSMQARIKEMRRGMRLFDVASLRLERDYARYKAVGLTDRDDFWDWYEAQSSTKAYRIALKQVQDAVEAALMTPPVSPEEEDAIMEALEVYKDIAPSFFALQTACDLFTPSRHQTYPLDRLRHWLLTDPEEDFEKTGMPGFLKIMRELQQNT